jgi:hypothetical protein
MKGRVLAAPALVRFAIDALVGMPVLHICNLMMSTDPSALISLGKISSGYMWQQHAMALLPLRSFLNLASQSPMQCVVHLGCAAAFIMVVYQYWRDGFVTVRRIRVIGDHLYTRLRLGERNNVTPAAVMMSGARAGWSLNECKAVCWFLLMMNLRLTRQTDLYTDTTPRAFSIVQVGRSASVVIALGTLHPIIAAIYVVIEARKLSEVADTKRRCEKHVANLPPEVLASVATS